MGDGWIRPAQVKLVHDAVLATCDAADGLNDDVVSNPVGCRKRFDSASLRCAGGARGDTCLTDAQVQAVRTLHSPLALRPVPLAHGVTEYPGCGIGGEGTPAFGPTGGWSAWWLGTRGARVPAGAGQRHRLVLRQRRDAVLLCARPAARRAPVPRRGQRCRASREVSQLLDSTNPDLTRLPRARRQAHHAGAHGRLRAEPVRRHPLLRVGGAAHGQGHASTASCACTPRPASTTWAAARPANVDMLTALANWVERGQAPAGLQLVEQEAQAAVHACRARGRCASGRCGRATAAATRRRPPVSNASR